MPTKVKIRSNEIDFGDDWTKAEIARYLLAEDDGYSASEISKAVPMSYSQVHQIAAKLNSAESLSSKAKATIEPASPAWGTLPPSGRPSARPVTNYKKGGRVGKLRTPGLPLDTLVGECANCGYDVVVRPTSSGFVLIHTGVSAEEYLATVQFCHAVPRSLIA